MTSPKKKHTDTTTGLFLLLIFTFSCCSGKEDLSVPKGLYLGQKPPGMLPEVFAPGIVSKGMNEAGIAFSPDGDEVYYNITHVTHGFTAIVFMEQKNGQWTKPDVAPFSGQYNDSDAFFSPDGQTLYFTSDRPLEPGEIQGNLDIWFVERNKSGWSAPKNIGSPINSEFVDANPCLTRDGTLYYASNRPGGFGSHDIYRSRFIRGKYTEPENLGESINTQNFESSPFVAPDGSYIIHNLFAGRDSETQSGLHVAFRREDGTWTQTKNMGDAINKKKPAMFAFVSHDGQYLFYTSDKVPYLPYSGERQTYDQLTQMFMGHQNGLSDIYWVDAKVIDQFRPGKKY